MLAVSEEMIIDAVDRLDSPIGEVERSEVFRYQINFRVVHIFVFNRRGELLVQQLANTRARHPRYWGSSVAGYLFAGESYEAAAQRRLAQELGVSDAGLTQLGKTSMSDEGCLKFICVFSTVHEGPFHFDHEHIRALDLVSIPEIRKLQNRGAVAFTPTFIRVLDFYESGR